MGFSLPDYSKCFFAACYDFPSCAAGHADALVWMADGRAVGCNYLYFYADCAAAGCSGRIFPADHAERQCGPAHLHLFASERRVIARRDCGLKKKNFISKRDSYDSDKDSRRTKYTGRVQVDDTSGLHWRGSGGTSLLQRDCHSGNGDDLPLYDRRQIST